MEEQVLEYLAQGMGKEDTLRTLGLLPEQFEAILATTGFTERLMKRAKECTAERITQRELRLEDKILKEMESHLSEYDAHGLSKIYQTITTQRKAGLQPAGHFSNPTVNNQIVLVLPANMQNAAVTTNDKNEVVAIGTRNMGALPLEGVKQLFSKFHKQGNTIDEGDLYATASPA